MENTWPRLLGLLTLVLTAFVPNGPVMGADDDDVADVPSTDLSVANDANKRYFLIGDKPDAPESKSPRPLLIVLPGGDGSADFHPFVKRIYRNALPARYLVAQLVAPKWDPGQQIVWPTQKSPVKGQKFTTEQFVADVIDEVRSKYSVDESRVFTLSWSSGGPAGYAVSLAADTRVHGSFIAMSVYKPSFLPPLERAKGHAYFLLHSPQDQVCPYAMARAASLALANKGAATKLVDYSGGHGWRGDVFGNLRQGIEWLEQNAQARATTKPSAK
ncbi:MAG: alpha/beta hydrolase [Bacillota bacterium]